MTPSTPTISDVVDRGQSHEIRRRPDAPSLREAAKHLIVPDGIERTVWPKVKYRLDTMGVRLDRWQEGFCRAALGVRDDGKYAATVGGVGASIPRQVGKTFLISHLMIAMCVEFPGLRVIWTSHHGRTTTNTFRAVQDAVRRPKVMLHLKKNNRNQGIRTGAGEQEIEFSNGSIMMFGARESGFGRGLNAIDVVVFDEAQILGLKALEDMVPATNAALNPHGGLVFFIGTPPRPTDDGEAFRTKRRDALTGADRGAMWVEIAGSDELGLRTQRQYRMANPSYPLRVPHESMERMAANLTDEGAWKREALGIWDEVDDGHVRLMPLWDERVAAGPPARQRPVAFGIDRDALDGVSIVAAWHMSETHVHIEEVLATPSMEEAADFLLKAARIKDTIFIDAYSAAAPLVPLLQARKRKPLRSSAAEFVASCALLDDGIARGDITHNGDSRIAAQVKAAGRREVKGGGWAWQSGGSGAPIHVLTAAGLAVLGARRQPWVDPAKPKTRKTPTRAAARAVNARNSRSSRGAA